MTVQPTVEMSRIEWEATMRQRETEAAAQYPSEIPACPSWCQMYSGHEYDSVDYTYEGGRHSHGRAHGATFDGPNTSVDVSVWEWNDGSALRLEEPRLQVYTSEPEKGEGLSRSDDARRLAANLLAAADLLDRLS